MSDNLELELNEDDFVVSNTEETFKIVEMDLSIKTHKTATTHERIYMDYTLPALKLADYLIENVEKHKDKFSNLRVINTDSYLELVGDVKNDKEKPEEVLTVSTEYVWDISKLSDNQLVIFTDSLIEGKTKQFEELCDLEWYHEIRERKHVYFFDNNYWVCRKQISVQNCRDARELFGEFEVDFEHLVLKEEKKTEESSIEKRIKELSTELVELQEYLKLKEKYGNI